MPKYSLAFHACVNFHDKGDTFIVLVVSHNLLHVDVSVPTLNKKINECKK